MLGSEQLTRGRTQAAAGRSHNAPHAPPGGRRERTTAGGGIHGGSEKCARALTSAGPSNQSSDSSNGRNGEYPLGLVVKEERRLEVEKGDCGGLRVGALLGQRKEAGHRR